MPECNCQNCVLHRELERAEAVVGHIAVRLGHSRFHSGDDIIKTFDFVMERYDHLMTEALAARAATVKPTEGGDQE